MKTNADTEVLEIAGEKFAPGETRDVQLRIGESYLGTRMNIPVRVIRGPRPGPKLFITGAIHGDEFTGIGIIRELLYDKPPELLRGTLICMPVVNIFGLEHHSRYLPDRRDLNRSFPGHATGSLTSRLAHAVHNQIIARCDYGLDFHSAAVRRLNYPNVRADMRHPAVRKLARAFGCELIVDGRGPEGSLRRTAVKANVPTIILEAGEVWKIDSRVVQTGVRGILNVLRSLDMLEGELEKPLFQITVEKTTWVRAERGGFMDFHARVGDLVREGTPIATNYNIFGREKNAVASRKEGIVLGMSTMPAVKPGDPICHIAILAPKTHARIRRVLERSGDPSQIARIRDGSRD